MINRYNSILLPLFFVLDILTITLAFHVGYYLRFDQFFFASYNYDLLYFVTIGIWSLAALIFRTYAERQGIGLQQKLSQLMLAQFLLLLGIFGYIVTIRGYFVSREFLALFIVLQFVCLVAWHILRHYIITWYRRQGRNFKRVIVLGDLPTNGDGSAWDFSDPSYGYRIEDQVLYHNPHPDYARVLENKLTHKQYDELLIASPALLGKQISRVIDTAEHHGLRVMIMPKFMHSFSERVAVDYISGQPILNVRYEPLRFLHNRVLKRLFDFVFSLLVFILFFWWFHLIVGLCIKLSSRGPVIFKQKRVGINGDEFFCYKFRTMQQDPQSEEKALNGAAGITEKKDERITWIGQLLRKTNLDELPQFMNVLKGDMSVVGPRPHMLQEDLEIREKVHKYRIRNFVKPGITGLAAVNGYRGGTLDLRLMQKRTNYDIYYIEHWSLVLDLKIIGQTIWQMLTFRIPNAY